MTDDHSSQNTGRHVQRAQRAERVGKLLLWGLWTASALPLLVLFIEFGRREMGECGDEWWHYATLYSHFFLYPVSFGLIATCLLHRPWALAVRYVYGLEGKTRMRTSGLLIASALMVIGFACYVEFTRSTPAIWSFEPASNNVDASGQSGANGDNNGRLERARALLQGRCERSEETPVDRDRTTRISEESLATCTDWMSKAGATNCATALSEVVNRTTTGADAAASLLSACNALLRDSCKETLDAASKGEVAARHAAACSEEFESNQLLDASCKVVAEEALRAMNPGAGDTDPWLRSVICRAWPSVCAGEQKTLRDEEQQEFKDLLDELEKDDGESWTQYAYYLGFMANTTLFAVLFATIFIAITFEEREADGGEPTIGSMLTQLSIALFFATFWMLMRITFLLEKLSIYPEDPLLAMNYLIFLAVVALYAHLVNKHWKRSKRYERQLQAVLSVAGVGVAVIGLFEQPLTLRLMPDLLIGLFGTGSSLLTYLGVLLFLLIVFLPGILRTWGVHPDNTSERG